METIKLGICCEPETFEKAKNFGFDYAEPSLQLFRSFDKNELKKNIQNLLDELNDIEAEKKPNPLYFITFKRQNQLFKAV